MKIKLKEALKGKIIMTSLKGMQITINADEITEKQMETYYNLGLTSFFDVEEEKENKPAESKKEPAKRKTKVKYTNMLDNKEK